MHEFNIDVDGSSLLLPPLYCAGYIETIKPRPLLGRGKFSHSPCPCPCSNKIVQERSNGLLLMHLTTLFCHWFLFLPNILTFTFMALLLLLHLSRHFQPWLLFLILFQNHNLGMRGSRLNFCFGDLDQFLNEFLEDLSDCDDILPLPLSAPFL